VKKKDKQTMGKVDWQQRADDIFNAWVLACGDGNLDENLLWDMAKQQWCNHDDVVPVAQTMSNGKVRRWWICAECGKGGLPQAKNALAKFDIDKLPPESDYQKILKESSAARTELSRRGRQAIKQKYYDYLSTPAWRDKRAAVLKRDGFVCRYCNNKATQVHHLTYDNIYNEPLSDLVAICKPCHDREHWYKQDRTQ
jgi:hypothetical protein